MSGEEEEEEGHTLRGRSLRMRMVRKSLRSSSTLTPSCRSSDMMLTTAPGHHNGKRREGSMVNHRLLEEQCNLRAKRMGELPVNSSLCSPAVGKRCNNSRQPNAQPCLWQ
jgi:hypothetical protein